MINPLRKYISDDIYIIPDCIDTRRLEHQQSYDMIRDTIYGSILRCCIKRIMRLDEIDEMVYEIMFVLSEIKIITEDDLYVDVYKYILERMLDYEEYSVYIEEYEMSSNINKMYNMLLNKSKSYNKI